MNKKELDELNQLTKEYYKLTKEIENKKAKFNEFIEKNCKNEILKAKEIFIEEWDYDEKYDEKYITIDLHLDPVEYNQIEIRRDQKDEIYLVSNDENFSYPIINKFMKKIFYFYKNIIISFEVSDMYPNENMYNLEIILPVEIIYNVTEDLVNKLKLELSL